MPRRPRRRATALALLLLLGLTSVTHAEESSNGTDEPALAGPGFVLVRGVSGEQGCLPPVGASDALSALLDRASDDVGIDPDLAVVLTAAPLSCAELYYVAQKNDVAGIGYGATEPSELFDYVPERARQGFVFLNDAPYWLDYPEELKADFLHEVGHRWLARVSAELDGERVALTGREGGHWSYFLDTGGSPLEGNAFEGEGPWTTATPRFPLRYAPLDLYLMGALPAEEVGPLRLLDEPVVDGPDCDGRPVTSASPPQRCEPRTLEGTWREFGASAIIAAEGPRLPSAEEAPRELTLAFFLLAAPGALERELCEGLAQRLVELPGIFATATGDRMSLRVVGGEGADCETLLASEPDEGEPSGCSHAPRPKGGPLALLLALLLLAQRRWMPLSRG